MRRLITRVIGLIPSMIIAIGVGRPGIDTLLIVSQVVLSVVLPFVTFPLVYLTGSRQVMRVRAETNQDDNMASPGDLENAQNWVYFNSGWLVSIIAWFIWVIIVVANVYVIVTLGLGES
jgi:metal iron transporter